MKYGIEIGNGDPIIYQFANESERAAWIALREGRCAISGTSREVKHALYHGQVLSSGEREKEISNA